MSTNNETVSQQKPRRVIFSFAAYAKEVITALKSSTNVHVMSGLTPTEIATVETTAGVTFPPDLRSILSEGLPVGPGFPNWRSSSKHQLCLLTSLPILSIVKEVSRDGFWAPAWGPRPEDDGEAVEMAKELLAGVPRLVPVFRHCYIACEPSLAGNPVFYVHGGEVRVLSVDVGEFYKTTQFWRKDWVLRRECITAATKVEFWSGVAESGGARRRKGWWSGELGECLEEVVWQLREGGWGEEDVREMMMMDDDVQMEKYPGRRQVKNMEGVARHVRSMSTELLRSGWSLDDVVYSLGDQVVKGDGVIEGENWVDIHCHSSNENALVLSR